MSPQRRTAALFDGRHDLELAQAQMATLSLAPSFPVGAEDIRDLQGTPPHSGPLRRRQRLDGADHFPHEVVGYLGVMRRRVQLFVPKQRLDHANVHLLFQ